MDRLRLAAWLPPAAVVATALALSFPSPQPAKIFPDSVTYLHWSEGRPPTVPLFYLVVRPDMPINVAQTVLSMIAWTAMGWTLLGLVGAVYAAALAVSFPVSLWNLSVLSESLGLTFGAALCAATLALGRGWTRLRFGIWAACALLFTGVRVENFLFVPPLCLALLLFHRGHWKAIAAVGGAAALLFLIFGVVLDRGTDHWQNRMTNVVLTRILTDPYLTMEFFNRGLPHDEGMLAAAGQMLKYYDKEWRAKTPAFQHWLDDESRATYMRWLATLAPHRYLFAAIDQITHRGNYDYYTGGLRLPLATTDVRFYDATQMAFRHWRWLAIVPIACAVLTWSLRFVDAFALAYFAALYVLAFGVFHGDTGEMDRHMVLIAALYRMAPIVALACVWEHARALLRRWRPPADATS